MIFNCNEVTKRSHFLNRSKEVYQQEKVLESLHFFTMLQGVLQLCAKENAHFGQLIVIPLEKQ